MGRYQAKSLRPTSFNDRPHEVVYADFGYRGVDRGNPAIEISPWGKDKRLTDEERKLLKRHQAIEPIIGHLNTDHWMDRCHLKGPDGDALHAVLCASGDNIRWLLRMIIKKGLGLLLYLLPASGLAGLFERLVDMFNQNRPRNSNTLFDNPGPPEAQDPFSRPLIKHNGI